MTKITCVSRTNVWSPALAHTPVNRTSACVNAQSNAGSAVAVGRTGLGPVRRTGARVYGEQFDDLRSRLAEAACTRQSEAQQHREHVDEIRGELAEAKATVAAERESHRAELTAVRAELTSARCVVAPRRRAKDAAPTV